MIVRNRLYYFLALFIISSSAISQELLDLNLIVTINDKINPSLTSVKINYTLKNGDLKKLDLYYLPGSLKITKSDFDKINNDSVTNLKVEIKYTKICKEDIKYYNYIIDDFKSNWLKNDFFILHIYDLDNKKYKKIFNPLPNKKFTYEYDSPAGSMRRVQKRKTNDQKKCE